MATKKNTSANLKSFRARPKKKRPGVHAKSKASKHKASKNYKKKYKGQGK
jgi:hypothetical protein